MLHRANRILMMAVLILLSLVLITTSVVSGIFAKYTLSRSVGLILGFERLGLKVNIVLSEAFAAAAKPGEEQETEDGIKIVIKDFTMKPGDIYTDALKLTVEGSPVSDVVFLVKTEIVYNDNSFLLPTETFSGDQANKYCMPIGFIAGTYDANNAYSYSYAVDPYSLFEDQNGVAAGIATKIAALTDLAVDETHKNLAAMNCTANVPITFGNNISALGFGFEWPREYSDKVTNSDEIGTWVSNQGHTFDIIYTIAVEQKT